MYTYWATRMGCREIHSLRCRSVRIYHHRHGIVFRRIVWRNNDRRGGIRHRAILERFLGNSVLNRHRRLEYHLRSYRFRRRADHLCIDEWWLMYTCL